MLDTNCCFHVLHLLFDDVFDHAAYPALRPFWAELDFNGHVGDILQEADESIGLHKASFQGAFRVQDAVQEALET